MTVNMGLRYELTPPWLDDNRHAVHRCHSRSISGPDRLPISKLHPYFLRQGSGDPYEGINLRWPDISVRRDGALGRTGWSEPTTTTLLRDLASPGVPPRKWVIRAGAGIFYSQDTGNPRFDMARNLAGRTRFESIGSTLYTFQTAFAGLAGAQGNRYDAVLLRQRIQPANSA